MGEGLRGGWHGKLPSRRPITLFLEPPRIERALPRRSREANAFASRRAILFRRRWPIEFWAGPPSRRLPETDKLQGLGPHAGSAPAWPVNVVQQPRRTPSREVRAGRTAVCRTYWVIFVPHAAMLCNQANRARRHRPPRNLRECSSDKNSFTVNRILTSNQTLTATCNGPAQSRSTWQKPVSIFLQQGNVF
jgi:hypothetical protein